MIRNDNALVPAMYVHGWECAIGEAGRVCLHEALLVKPARRTSEDKGSAVARLSIINSVARVIPPSLSSPPRGDKRKGLAPLRKDHSSRWVFIFASTPVARGLI